MAETFLGGSARLEGKAAVVVGAGQTVGETMGNGRAVSLLFAAEGAQLLLVDRDAESLAVTASMAREHGVRVHELVSDIARETSGDELLGAIDAFGGRVDILHNNVGIATGDGEAHLVEERRWQLILDVNLTGMWRTCKHVIPLMREQGSGAIVNVSSIAAVAAATKGVAYKVSKAGVNALTETLAIANAEHGIRVNAVMPGLIDTPLAVDAVARISGSTRDEIAVRRAALAPLGRQGTAWDVAKAALYLACDDARFVTGVILPVDGGQSIRTG